MNKRTSVVPSIFFSLCFALGCVFAQAAGATVSTTTYGATGDGITDDTANLQQALTYCSDYNLECRIPAGASHYITGPLFIWGGASLSAEEGGELIFNAGATPYLLNLGIAAMVNPSAPTANLRDPFTGKISDVTFRVIGGTANGRIIYFWRSRDAEIVGNHFEVGALPYSATSSGNHSDWVSLGGNTIRENVTITDNVIIATANHQGSEGIGLNTFNRAVIERNTVIGVGDDPIGIHWSDHVTIRHNDLKSVDGRLFVSNSTDVEIAYNRHERMASPLNDTFYEGVGLIWVGFETHAIPPTSTWVYNAPDDIRIRHNELRYPAGAIDAGAAIYLHGTRRTVVEKNFIVNESDSNDAASIYLLPARVIGWDDPSGDDEGVTLTVGSTVYNIARVYETTVDLNISTGTHPLGMRISDNCPFFPGPVKFTRNVGPARSDPPLPGERGYDIYCPFDDKSGNKGLFDTSL